MNDKQAIEASIHQTLEMIDSVNNAIEKVEGYAQHILVREILNLRECLGLLEKDLDNC